DNGVTVSQNRISPFISGAATLTALAITDTSGPHPLSFNGSAVGFPITRRIEMAMTPTISILGGIVIEGTLAGGATDANGNASSSGLSFSSKGGLFGISIHP